MFKFFKNSLRSADVISQELKLHSMTETGTRQKTYFGGILSIIVVFLGLAVTGYFLSFLFLKTDPKAFQVTKYSDDTEKIFFDNSEFFFIMQVWSHLVNFNINDTVVKIVGVQRTNNPYSTLGTYYFEKCNYDRDFQGMEEVFTRDHKDNYEQTWWCIVGMMENETIIPKNDPRYRKPYTQHGMSSKSQNPIYFEIQGQRCINSTANNFSCMPKEAVDNILQGGSYTIQFADNFFDPSNYDQPISQYIHQIAGAASPTNLASNYMNINNVDFTTHDGLIFDNANTILSYQFSDRVEIVTPNSPGEYDNIFFFFRLESQNTPIMYERTYTRLQEQLANIGGMVKVLFILAKVLNSIYAFLMTQPLYLKKVFETFISSESYMRFKSTLKGGNRLETLEMSKKINQSHADTLFVKFSNTHESQRVNNNKSENGSFDDFKNNKIKLSTNKASTNIRSKIVEYTIYKNSIKIKNKIFNEFTIYKLFFEVEKLKRLLFNRDQNEAFDQIKLDMNSLFIKKHQIQRRDDLIEKLGKNTENINVGLVKLLKTS